MAKKKSSILDHIPEFASIEEEAPFWDTHSTADYEDEFRPVRARFAKRFSTGIAIRRTGRSTEHEEHRHGPHAR